MASTVQRAPLERHRLRPGVRGDTEERGGVAANVQLVPVGSGAQRGGGTSEAHARHGGGGGRGEVAAG
eukprot:scaffold53137_cov55-Phaeocystis_antarctica.AAC.2